MSSSDRDPPPKYFGDYPDGAYWSAARDGDHDDDEPVDHNVSGDTIRFMWDYGVRVPLWDAEGLLPEDPEWLRAALGLGDELISDLDRWGRDMHRLDGTAPPEDQYEAMDVRAQDLVERLRRELDARISVRYQRW